MKKLIAIFSIVGGLVIALTIAIIFFTSPPQVKPPYEPLTKEVLVLIQSAKNKNEEAKKILSKNNLTEEDHAKAKQLLEESINEAKKATEIQPQSPETWFFLSQLYKEFVPINHQALSLEEDALKKAIALNPTNARLYQELATIYIISKKYEDAKGALFTSIRLDPQDANAYFKLGNIYKELGEKDKAREAYLQAKKLTPENSEANNVLIDHQLQTLEK